MAFLQGINTANIVSFLNFVLLMELVYFFMKGMKEGVLAGKITTRQIIWVTIFTAISFCLWQMWPSNLALLAVLPQTGFWVFAGGLTGCILNRGCSNLMRSL
ncbi:hypothetical protein [Kamptonema sp. PCC 6506]|uniref:hypothetical protein n=2 Tax=Kamptonema TaxID=1501433 RepID=UPI000475ACCB|nr:hypothetical protein [Kamptonema sp. PCC 6506]